MKTLEEQFAELFYDPTTVGLTDEQLRERFDAGIKRVKDHFDTILARQEQTRKRYEDAKLKFQNTLGGIGE